MEYTLGLDIGITSVGACAIDQDNAKLIELSVRKFDQAKEAKEARLNRSSRRTTRRKRWRKQQLKNAFVDFGIISKDDIEKHNYLNFYGSNDGLIVPDVLTIYHLRQKAIKEKISKREILLCLYNIMQARGHFLLDTIDFTKNGLSFNIFKEKFYDLCYEHIDFKNNLVDFEKNVLKRIYDGTIKANELKAAINNGFTIDDDDNLLKLCKIINGNKSEIGVFYGAPDEKSVDIENLKKSDELNDFQSQLVELYDICRISRFLKDDCQYVCDIAVKNIDEYSTLKKNKAEKEAFKKWEGVSKSKKHIRAYKNLNNSYPNGLYVKEIKAILNNQKKYHPEITDAFIEVCCTICSARIPYYIGPLSKHAKNSWVEKNGRMKYSYDYSRDKVDELESIKKWKLNMVSHCTYLPEEVALPKGSLLGEVFSIVNELNNYNCIDKNNNDYHLTRDDKIKIFDELFFKQESVTFRNVEEIIGLKTFGSLKGRTTKFNNKITLYRTISEICPELKMDSVSEVLSNKSKLNKIENLILDINLFDEGSLKNEYFKEKFNNDQAIKLGKLKADGFYSFSKRFIFETTMNVDGETMMDILFNNNVSSSKNNQQVIISKACDKNGNKIDFLANKFEKIIRKNNNQLSIDLIIDEGKPTIPISRPVVRALNESFKIYNGYLETYGVPKRVVIETAKGKDSIKDFSDQKTFTEESGSSMKHYAQMPKLVDYLFDQINEKDKNNAILQGTIEKWEEIESYYNKHKQEIELYIRQDGIDLLTGKRIDINHLDEYEIDHILPRGFGDDSQNDKMLTSKIANGIKGNRLPIEFLESEDAPKITSMTVSHFEKIVNKLAEMKMISKKKQEILLLKNQNEAEGFINQNLVDTRYIISQFAAMLKAFNKVNDYNTHVVCMNSAYTKLYSKVLRFRKDRELGDQHHAYDAACLCIADKCLSEYFPNYDQQRNAFSKKGEFVGYGRYQEVIKDINNNNDDSSKRKLNRFIHYVFKKAYGQDLYKLGKEAPLIEDIKNTTPLISWKVQKNYDGQLFDVNPISSKKTDDSKILSLLGINNSLKSYKSLQLAAIDFYKIHGKHYIVHIPYCIIKKGVIDKDKYIKLVKEHYKAKDLIDENGELITKAYRFRLFKNDIIFDNKRNEQLLFAFGSAQNKSIEVKKINIFSYNQIYNSFGRDIAEQLTERFDLIHYDLRKKEQCGNKDFKDYKIIDYVDYLCNEFEDFSFIKNNKTYFEKLCKDCNNLNEFSLLVNYCYYLFDSKFSSDSDGRIRFAPNNIRQFVHHEEDDDQYIKIKYNILGIRFKLNKKGKIIIEGPKGYINGGYKLIKKENFNWTISRNMIK